MPARQKTTREGGGDSRRGRRHQQRRRPKRKPQQRLRRRRIRGGWRTWWRKRRRRRRRSGGGTAAAGRRETDRAAGGTGPGPVAVVFKTTSRDDASRVRIYGGRDASREETSRRRVRNRVRFRRRRLDPGGARSKSNLGRSVVRPRVRVAGGAFRALVRERGCARARSSSQATPRAKSDARARFETARRAVLREFHHPIVGGPGFGDPLKMAADKLAYARVGTRRAVVPRGVHARRPG